MRPLVPPPGERWQELETNSKHLSEAPGVHWPRCADCGRRTNTRCGSCGTPVCVREDNPSKPRLCLCQCDRDATNPRAEVASSSREFFDSMRKAERVDTQLLENHIIVREDYLQHYAYADVLRWPGPQAIFLPGTELDLVKVYVGTGSISDKVRENQGTTVKIGLVHGQGAVTKAGENYSALMEEPAAKTVLSGKPSKHAGGTSMTSSELREGVIFTLEGFEKEVLVSTLQSIPGKRQSRRAIDGFGMCIGATFTKEGARLAHAEPGNAVGKAVKVINMVLDKQMGHRGFEWTGLQLSYNSVASPHCDANNKGLGPGANGEGGC